MSRNVQESCPLLQAPAAALAAPSISSAVISLLRSFGYTTTGMQVCFQWKKTPVAAPFFTTWYCT